MHCIFGSITRGIIRLCRIQQSLSRDTTFIEAEDKLPKAVLDKAHIAVELSQQEKLFRIENG